MNDTIFGLATAAGRSAVAIVRVSGPASHDTLSALTRRPLPAVREAAVRRLFTPDGETLDEALVIRWSAPKSFTGEHLVELHLHGGVAVIEGVLETLCALGVRPAGPGEFTRRAFENQKLSFHKSEEKYKEGLMDAYSFFVVRNNWLQANYNLINSKNEVLQQTELLNILQTE